MNSEETRKIVRGDGSPFEREGTLFDQPQPQGPPCPMERIVPESLMPVYGWLQQVVRHESLLLDLALERAIEIVDFHYARGAYGTDLMEERSRDSVVKTSIPLAVRLYEESCKAVNLQADVYKKLLDDAAPKA